MCRHAVLYDSFNGQEAAGPIPVFFSLEPEASKARLSANAEWAFHACQCLHSKCLEVTMLSKQQAAEYIKKPGMSRILRPLCRTWTGMPQSKKARTEDANLLAQTGDSAGTF